MDGQEEPGGAGKEELVSSWQDLRGRIVLSEEHKWETIAGGRHADVVALEGGMEAFSELSCVKIDDHHAGGFLTVCKGSTPVGMAGSPEASKPPQQNQTASESLPDSPKSTHEQVCFDDEEAELLPAAKPMQFEGTDCVQPCRPQEAVEAVPDVDGDNDAEHEASSLDGSDHEYAFVFEKPLSSLAVSAFMQEEPNTAASRLPARAILEPSRQAAFPPTPPPTPQETTPRPPPDSPPPPATELGEGPQDASARDSAGAIDEQDARPDSNHEAAVQDCQAEEQAQEPGSIEGAGLKNAVSKEAEGAHRTEAEGESSGGKGEPERAGNERELARGYVAAEARQRSLDEVGVIPGGRAAFGAPPPSLRPQPVVAPGSRAIAAAMARLRTRGRCRGCCCGGWRRARCLGETCWTASTVSGTAAAAWWRASPERPF